VGQCLKTPTTGGTGDGERLAGKLVRAAKAARHTAFEEDLGKVGSEKSAKLGSKKSFDDLKDAMTAGSDVLIYIHGFNVDWHEAVASAAALELMLNKDIEDDPAKPVRVVLFSWPSDGTAIPWASYKSDRTDAAGSGNAVGRAFLKLRDYLADLRDRPWVNGKRAKPGPVCGSKMHLLCHSMGNYVLQNAVARMREYLPNRALPRLFEHIFMCAPDVDDDVLEPARALGEVHQLARCVTVYFNRGDTALHVSDYTKGNPERLGTNGPARPGLVHNKVHSVDCSTLVKGFVEHSYYLNGLPNRDIRCSVADVPVTAEVRRRIQDRELPNVWRLQ